MRIVYIFSFIFILNSTPLEGILAPEYMKELPKKETREEREERRRREEFHRELALKTIPWVTHAILQPIGTFLGVALTDYKKETFGFLTTLAGIGTYYTFEKKCNKYAKGIGCLTSGFLGLITLKEWYKERTAQKTLEELRKNTERRRRYKKNYLSEY